MAVPEEEVLQVSLADAVQLQGKGEIKLRTIEQRSCAQLVVEKDQGGGRVRIRGQAKNIAKARRMLTAMFAFSEEASAEERGTCKWFASGFCRFGSDGGNCCQDGLHSADQAQKAEQDWLASAPPACTEPVQARPLLLSVACEGPGLRGSTADGEDEIVDFAVVAVCPSSGKELGRFHRFVRPSRWEREDEQLRQRFESSCFNSATTAVSFTEVLADLLDWIPGILQVELDALTPEDVLFISHRDHEVQYILPRQCNTPSPGAVDAALQNFFFNRWACLKDAFRSQFSLPIEAAPHNIPLMLRHLGLPILNEGQRSLCTEGASNVSRILRELIHKGWKAEPTAWRDEVNAPTQFLLPGGMIAVGGATKRLWSDVNGGLPPVRAAPYPPLLQTPPAQDDVHLSSLPMKHPPPLPPAAVAPPPLQPVMSSPMMVVSQEGMPAVLQPQLAAPMHQLIRPAQPGSGLMPETQPSRGPLPGTQAKGAPVVPPWRSQDSNGALPAKAAPPGVQVKAGATPVAPWRQPALAVA